MEMKNKSRNDSKYSAGQATSGVGETELMVHVKNPSSDERKAAGRVGEEDVSDRVKPG